jgi:hypothetical protein
MPYLNEPRGALFLDPATGQAAGHCRRLLSIAQADVPHKCDADTRQDEQKNGAARVLSSHARPLDIVYTSRSRNGRN